MTEFTEATKSVELLMKVFNSKFVFRKTREFSKQGKIKVTL